MHFTCTTISYLEQTQTCLGVRWRAHGEQTHNDALHLSDEVEAIVAWTEVQPLYAPHNKTRDRCDFSQQREASGKHAHLNLVELAPWKSKRALDDEKELMKGSHHRSSRETHWPVRW
jgi:hypothetical protein